MKHLEKYVIIAALFFFSVGAFSQTSKVSLLGKLGYQTDFKRFGLEIGGRYNANQEVRLAPAVSFWIPKNDCLGLNVDLNVQYVFAIPNSGLDLYPLMGLNMSNNDWDSDIKIEGKKIKSHKWTDWGFNLGLGTDYSISNSDFLNFEFKYVLGDKNFATFMLGYGYRF